MTALAAPAQAYAPDASASSALTRYLKKHKLPLVGAQVSIAPDGSRKVLLYGFVATDFGKTDARKKARAFLHDPDAEIISHIVVRPEIRHKPPSAAGTGAGGQGSTTDE